MPKRRAKTDLDDSEAEEKPADCYTPEEVVERERAERCADVMEKWWYRDRYGEGQMLRYRLEANDCNVILQTVCDGEHWVTGWPATKKVPLYQAYETGELPVFIVEGEFAVQAARAMGLSAVTSAGGADDVEYSDWQPAAGRPVVILPANSADGRRFARAVARMVLPLGPPPVVRMLALPGLEEGADIANFGEDSGLSPAELGKKVRELADRCPEMKPADVAGWPIMRTMLRSPPKAVRWLWPGRAPIGKPMVIFGGLDPGKSIVALNLAARVSAGAPWPDGGEAGDGAAGVRAPRGNVILMTRGDNLRDTVRPRLDRAGADPQRIITLDTVARVIGGNEVRREITLHDLADLERAIEMAGNVQLLVVDPLSAYFGRHRPTSNSIPEVIRRLTDLADRHALAVIMTAELGGRDGLGHGPNMSLISAVRQAWILHEEPQNRRLLLPIKTITGATAGGLACIINQDAVEWEPTPIALDAYRVAATGLRLPGILPIPLAVNLPGVSLPAVSLSNPSNPPNPSPGRRGPKPVCRDAARQWLQEQLTAGPVPVGAPKQEPPEPGTLRAAARSAGLAWGSVLEASRELHVVSEKSADTGKRHWRLPISDPAPPGTEQKGEKTLTPIT